MKDCKIQRFNFEDLYCGVYRAGVKVITPIQDITAMASNHSITGHYLYNLLYGEDISYEDYFISMFFSKNAILIEIFKDFMCIFFPDNGYITINSFQYEKLCELYLDTLKYNMCVWSNLSDEDLSFDELLVLLKDYVNDDLNCYEEFDLSVKNIKK